jgi:hypothetical protein
VCRTVLLLRTTSWPLEFAFIFGVYYNFSGHFCKRAVSDLHGEDSTLTFGWNENTFHIIMCLGSFQKQSYLWDGLSRDALLKPEFYKASFNIYHSSPLFYALPHMFPGKLMPPNVHVSVERWTEDHLPVQHYSSSLPLLNTLLVLVLTLQNHPPPLPHLNSATLQISSVQTQCLLKGAFRSF